MGIGGDGGVGVCLFDFDGELVLVVDGVDDVDVARCHNLQAVFKMLQRGVVLVEVVCESFVILFEIFQTL